MLKIPLEDFQIMQVTIDLPDKLTTNNSQNQDNQDFRMYRIAVCSFSVNIECSRMLIQRKNIFPIIYKNHK